MYQFVKIFTHSLEFIHRHVLERFFDVVDPLVFHGISGSMDSVVGFCRMTRQKSIKCDQIHRVSGYAVF